MSSGDFDQHEEIMELLRRILESLERIELEIKR